MTHTVIWVAGSGGHPAWEDTAETAFMGRWSGDTIINVPYPVSRYPIAIETFSDLMSTLESDTGLGESVTEGVAALDQVIRDTPGPKIVVGVTQGAFVVHEVQNMYVGDVTAPPFVELEFWYVGDAAHPQRAGLRKPDWTFPPPSGYAMPAVRNDSVYNTIQVVREYDGICDWPDSPQLWPAIQNAISGAQRYHGRGYNVDLDSLDLSHLSVEVNTVGANTTTFLLPSPELPMLQWMRNARVHPTIVETDTEDQLKPRVDEAYNRRVSTILRPTTGALTLTGHEPRIDNPYVARPDGGDLTLTGGQPDIMVGDRLVVPMGGLLTLTGHQPIVSPQRIVTSGGLLTLTGHQPKVVTPQLVAPTGRTLLMTGGQPDVEVNPAAVVEDWSTYPGNSNYSAATATFGSYTPQLGDVVYILRVYTGTNRVVSPPSGWVNTLGTPGSKVESNNHGFIVVHHVVTASEVTNGTINYNAYGVINASVKGPSIGWVVRNGDASAPVDSLTTRSAISSTTTYTFPDLPAGTVQSGSLPLALVATYAGGLTGATVYTFNGRTVHPFAFTVANLTGQPSAVPLTATMAFHNLIHP